MYSLKYQKSTTLTCKDLETRKSVLRFPKFAELKKNMFLGENK